MKNVIALLFILSNILLQSCIQAPSSTRKSALSSSSTTGSTGTAPTTPPTFAADEAIYWFTTTKILSTVTLNRNSQDLIYLRGKLVHDFLTAKDVNNVDNFRKQFCLSGNFTNTALYKPVRIRAIPITVKSSNNALERLLRIDIPSTTDNTSACNDVSVATTAFSLDTICTNCTGQLSTKSLSLFETTPLASGLANLKSVPAANLDLSTMTLRVDLASTSTSPVSSCTNSSCSAKGFDCCISGQCVMDATEKPNVSSNQSLAQEYARAKIDIANNPLAFINYPNIYFICSNISHNPPASTTPPATTPISNAQSRVSNYLGDYTCISDVAAGLGYNNCLNTNSTLTKTEAAYLAIKKKLALSCGCLASDSEIAIKCPDWGLVPVYKTGAAQTNANITDFACYTPAPTNPLGSITNLNVNVPNRSAPHRFYSTAGINYDDLTGIQSKAPTTTQEGDDFSYLDEFNKMSPTNGSYNLNSILGKMTVDLSHTLPAKMINVELGKTYILSSVSGYFTPCSTCSKDSWFQNFTAHPNSQRGVGLQAIGYSTSRDTYSSNTTLGNYEDTKFGRACYIPVTMVPLSHQKNANLNLQRMNRLKTQSAFYINGYQKDWFGFNQGALIGSFDGVTWFAVGNGRRATATSTKLYLAINAPFLDLADRTDTVVNIIPDYSANSAADYDFDPTIALNDVRQNTGATCQRFHQCNADADCVTQLGWEYVCADVSQYKTKWPSYDADAKELVNQELNGTLFDILQSTISTTNTKRCIYRGIGAPCKVDYTTLSDVDKKTLTCAPNFYCASLSKNQFNDELVRSPNELDGILFGMEANILGRPLNYVNASKYLTSEIIDNIKYNANSAIHTDGEDMGICRPGKLLTLVEKDAHANPDPSRRTDYISQISSCNSAEIGSTRFMTCPAFDSNLNYVDPNSTTEDPELLRQTQNSCGAEAKHITTAYSAFRNIESGSLRTILNITQPTLVQDACFRRAGSVCNSDLDCGPNKMHENAVSSLDIKYFGGTEAEQNYWRESLICGQGTAVPAPGMAGYLDYKLSENRCCREIGKDFTMYTQGPASIVPENAGSNATLETKTFAHINPRLPNRYSRYAISKNGNADDSKIPAVNPLGEPAQKQWEVINETGSLTCCGGGWIRKFVDGTHDWTIKNRLNVDTSNFSCLNFRSPLADSTYKDFALDKIVQTSFQREFELFCKSPDVGGCLQISYPPSNGNVITTPTPYDPALSVEEDPAGVLPPTSSGYSRIDTSPSSNPTSTWHELLNVDAPYTPRPYNYLPVPLDTIKGVAYPFFTDYALDFGVEMYLPAFVGWDGNYGTDGSTPADPTFINHVYIKYFFDPPRSPLVELREITTNIPPQSECDSVITSPDPGSPISGISRTDGAWCIVSNAKTSNRPVVLVKADISSPSLQNWKYAGIAIDFKTIETKKGTKVATPGNPLYYLTKLGRLELIGIPQVTYEPLYCNTDQNKVVPGIFKAPLTTRTSFETTTKQYNSFDPITSYSNDPQSTGDYNTGYGNYQRNFTYQDKLDHPAVFSSKDFTCCTPLGKTTTDASRCCSGFAVKSKKDNSLTCKLPKGTDLHVYFNKFVSSEGVGADQPGGGLTLTAENENEVDFNAFTGEPKIMDSTNNKLFLLGGSYCQGSGIVTGGAFGLFPPEPFAGSYTTQSGGADITTSFPTSIIDSVLDNEKVDPTHGKVPFDNGNRWNHHFYCK